ncbi:hypothetical protein RHSIM_Rhsim02G0137000 [Rhododendron simsii]|uniref:Disease resistance R13L4/SHOC-2-like LRR domain-containing protein n=1 Tax=Rhododendron simsii TaxID=118357 RepID=A0A834LSS5_RHOSS|nr:hypothetical protein RHSIM_Rhsim02G0137000 [Rhododendron simsii]
MDGCHLSSLSEEIGNLISLRTLNLARNNLSTLPESIYNLTCLKRLCLEENIVSNLPSGIGRLTSLESLYLSRNSLCTLPDTIGKLSCLKVLLVGNNKLSHLPSEIGDLDSLETLELWGNKGFRALPESICKLVRLQKLNLNCCHLSHLPCGIGGFTSLEFLNIKKNNICTIPDSNINLARMNHCGNLRSLPKLPRCTSVWADRCPSLEILPLELDQLGRWTTGWKMDYSESNKLAENSHLTSLLKQLPKSKGLSELQHVVPARDEEVRIWFPYHDGRGPNVSFVVPPSPSPSMNQKIVGWILCLLVWRPRDDVFRGLYIQDVIFNKIEKRGLFNFEVIPSDVVHVWLVYIPQGYKGLKLQGDDEVEIPIYGSALVKNWAIDVIYEADEELHKGNNTLYQGIETVTGLILKATDVQVNAKPFEKIDKLWYCVHVLEVRRDGMGLSELQHVVSIVVPAGDEEVHIWFLYHGRGRNVYFVVLPSPSVKQKMLGWILRVLVSWAPQEASHLFPKLYIQEGYAGLKLEGGDEVEIPIDEYSETLVKNWDFDLIYEADEIDKGNDTLYQVVSI